jgi:NhaD family Na+/H+ antiporter
MSLKNWKQIFCLLPLALFPCLSFASESSLLNLNMTSSPLGYLTLLLFVIAYVLVVLEEFTHMRKSKPVLLMSSLMWAVIAWGASTQGASQAVATAVTHNLQEYAQLLLFLLVAMTYVSAMQERHVFDALRAYLVRKNFSYRSLFWITGFIAFFLSPIADNLTTALVLCAVILAVGKDSPKFVSLCCISIVVAANAGGAFSPFGDITTLMVWQEGKIQFFDFFVLFFPCLANYLVPAFFMSLAVPQGRPASQNDHVILKPGAIAITVLFLFTIFITVMMHLVLHLPPVIGMMMGLSFVQFYSYYARQVVKRKLIQKGTWRDDYEFDIFHRIANVEWDTLLFFYGIVLAVGALATVGYLHLLSTELYTNLGSSLSPQMQATPANVIIGVLSSIIDNIPIMYAVLTMDPVMSEGQWLLVTLTAGVGGSLLSIGSAAGVGLMGQARGLYTFFSHLKWTWAIFLGYIVSIALHIWLNVDVF